MEKERWKSLQSQLTVYNFAIEQFKRQTINKLTAQSPKLTAKENEE